MRAPLNSRGSTDLNEPPIKTLKKLSFLTDSQQEISNDPSISKNEYRLKSYCVHLRESTNSD